MAEGGASTESNLPAGRLLGSLTDPFRDDFDPQSGLFGRFHVGPFVPFVLVVLRDFFDVLAADIDFDSGNGLACVLNESTQRDAEGGEAGVFDATQKFRPPKSSEKSPPLISSSFA